MATIDVNAITTIYGQMIQVAASSGRPLPIIHDSTFNNQLGIQANTEITSLPTFKALMVGTKGYKNIDTGTRAKEYAPKVDNANLYGRIPIRCRHVEEDLTEAERALYCLRSLETRNSEQYWFYWAKRMVGVTNALKIIIDDPNNGTSNWQFDPATLTPVPPTTTTESVSSAATTVTVGAEATVSIYGYELAEAFSLFPEFADYPEARQISEYGYISGVNKIITTQAGDGSTITFNELVYAQLAIHECFRGFNLPNPNNYAVCTPNFGAGAIPML